MIYEQITGRMEIDKIQDYCNFLEKEISPFLNGIGKLIGFWTKLTSTYGSFVEIWAFKDGATYGKAWDLFLNTDKGKEYMKEFQNYFIESRIEILHGTSLSPT